MLYAIIVLDQEGSAAAREEHREGHLSHFRAHKERIALAGPLSSDAGNGVGSLIVYEAESETDALAFVCADPFYPAAVWGEPIVAKLKGSIFAPELFAQ